VRLAAAIQLDREAALRSASWGLGQIMGDNFAPTGFADVETMVQAFVASEDQQLAGMASFVSNSPMLAALQSLDWRTFARLYNGPNYAANHYDSNLASAYSRYQNNGNPDIRVRQAQVYLNYLGYDTGGIDGIKGGRTTQALIAFQQQEQIVPADGGLSPQTLTALENS
jgi:hypothetical protein